MYLRDRYGLMNIVFVQTGGTIDKDYPRSIGGYAFEIDIPAFLRILKHINPAFTYEIVPAFRKDSTDIEPDDRAALKDLIEGTTATHFVITHGTDTMKDTAEVLSSIRDKIIVLTGALRPERFKETDADFNLGVAVGAVQTLEPGVYIAMSGRVYPWDKVEHEEESGRFIEG